MGGRGEKIVLLLLLVLLLVEVVDLLVLLVVRLLLSLRAPLLLQAGLQRLLLLRELPRSLAAMVSDVLLSSVPRRQWPTLAAALVHPGLLLEPRALLSGAAQRLVLLVVRLLLSLRRQWPAVQAAPV